MDRQTWRIELFEGLRIVGNGAAFTHFESRRVALLLARLALYPDRHHPRDVLAEELWPDEPADATRERFRHALSVLRHLLEPEGVPPGSVLAADRTQVHLCREAFVTDVVEFEAALASAATSDSPAARLGHLRRALDLYRGELLPGFYEEWILRERERLAQAHRGALCDAAVAAGFDDLPAAIEYARRAVAADPLAEDAHRQLIRLYAAAGRAPEALRQYRELERILRAEFGSAPGESTRELLETIRAGSARQPGESPAHAAAPPGRSPEHNSVTRRPPCGQSLHHSTVPALPDLEPDGGAVPLDSPFYLERPTDAAFLAALARGDSIVLVKGARQIGKTSLLARGLDRARQEGAHVVFTDLQKFTAGQLESADALFLTIARELADQLELEVSLETAWNPQRGWNVNLERFVRRELLGKGSVPIVWALDEVDRLFGHQFSSEVFGLFRSWHNQRSIDPGGPWRRLTLAVAYATEAHLFITDLNQSPFNVGTRLQLEDFSRGEVAEMNRRYGGQSGPPLRDTEEVRRFHTLVGGHPYLVRRGLHAIVSEGLDLDALERQVEAGTGVFADHLRRMLNALRQGPDLADALSGFCRGTARLAPDAFYRLRSAGVLAGRLEEEARFRCRLYQQFLEGQLR